MNFKKPNFEKYNYYYISNSLIIFEEYYFFENNSYRAKFTTNGFDWKDIVYSDNSIAYNNESMRSYCKLNKEIVFIKNTQEYMFYIEKILYEKFSSRFKNISLI